MNIAQVVMVSGEIDLHSAPRWRAKIAAMLGGHPSVLVLDLAQVTFMDSEGLNLLVDARRMAIAHHVLIELRNPSPFVTRVLDISGIDRLF